MKWIGLGAKRENVILFRVYKESHRMLNSCIPIVLRFWSNDHVLGLFKTLNLLNIWCGAGSRSPSALLLYCFVTNLKLEWTQRIVLSNLYIHQHKCYFNCGKHVATLNITTAHIATISNARINSLTCTKRTNEQTIR